MDILSHIRYLHIKFKCKYLSKKTQTKYFIYIILKTIKKFIMSIELISPNDAPKLANLFSFGIPSQPQPQSNTNSDVELEEYDFQDDGIEDIDFDEEDLSDTKEQNKNNSRVVKSFTKQTRKDVEHEHIGLRNMYEKRLEKVKKSLEELSKDKLTYETVYKSLKKQEKSLTKEIEQIDEKFELYKEKNLSVFQDNENKKDNNKILEKYDVTINMYVNSIVMYHMNENKEMENKFLKMATALKDEDDGLPFDAFVDRLKQKANQLKLNDFENAIDEKLNQIIQKEQEVKQTSKSKLKM